MLREDFEELDPEVEGVQSYLELKGAQAKKRVKDGLKMKPKPFLEDGDRSDLDQPQPHSSGASGGLSTPQETTIVAEDTTGVTKMLEKMSFKDFEGFLRRIHIGEKNMMPEKEAELLYQLKNELDDGLEEEPLTPPLPLMPSKEEAKPKRKKPQKKVRETVIKPEEAPGYQGTEEDVDKLLEFIEGGQTKSKRTEKEKKKEVKPKKNQKQTLQKAVTSTKPSVELKTTPEDGKKDSDVLKLNPVPVVPLDQKQTPQNGASSNEASVEPDSKTITEDGNDDSKAKPGTQIATPSASSKDLQWADEAKKSDPLPTASKVLKTVPVTNYEDLKSEKGYESDGSYVLASNRKKTRQQCERVSVRPSNSTYQPRQEDSSRVQRRYTDPAKFGGPPVASVTKSYVNIVRSPKQESFKPRSASTLAIDSTPVSTSKERPISVGSTPTKLEAFDLHFPPLTPPSAAIIPTKTVNLERKPSPESEKSLQQTVKSLVQRVQTLEQNVQELMQSKKSFEMPQKAKNRGNRFKEPVVFCGINFSTSQAPAGRKTGFEFGFGVMETLKNNTLPDNSTSSSATMKRWNVEAATFVPATRTKTKVCK